MNLIEDKDIIEKLRANPDVGFRLFMQKYKEPLYWHIRRLVVLYDDAKDVAQETFIRIFQHIDQYNADKSFSAWVYRIATNEALRFLGRKNEDRDTLDEALQVMADEYIDYSDLEAVKLQKAIHSLPPKQQAAFNMRYYDEMSYEDIAQATDSTPAAVKMNYKLAKDKITKYFQENE